MLVFHTLRQQFNTPVFPNQRELFRFMWDNLPRVSEISGERIREAQAWNFAHIIPKGKFSRLKNNIWNICLMTKDEHTLYDDHPEKARKDKRFDWVFIWAQELERQYFSVGPKDEVIIKIK